MDHRLITQGAGPLSAHTCLERASCTSLVMHREPPKASRRHGGPLWSSMRHPLATTCPPCITLPARPRGHIEVPACPALVAPGCPRSTCPPGPPDDLLAMTGTPPQPWTQRRNCTNSLPNADTDARTRIHGWVFLHMQ